ncbi:hypothetical protein K3Z93_03160, partial [Pseudomonas aeruginosa]|nr:hypothetical protein [Pseudomonas aeruginosa]
MGVHKADRKGKTDEHAWAGSDPASAQARREALYLVLAQVPLVMSGAAIACYSFLGFD